MPPPTHVPMAPPPARLPVGELDDVTTPSVDVGDDATDILKGVFDAEKERDALMSGLGSNRDEQARPRYPNPWVL